MTKPRWLGERGLDHVLDEAGRRRRAAAHVPHDYCAVAATADALGNVTYTDGTIGVDDSGNYQYTPVNTVTGSFVTGDNSRIDVHAPLGDVGLASGTHVGTVSGATDEGNPVTGLIVDTAAGNGSWTLGTTSCIG